MEKNHTPVLLLMGTVFLLFSSPAAADASPKHQKVWTIAHDGVGPIRKDTPIDKPMVLKRLFKNCKVQTSTKMQDQKPHEKIVEVTCGGKPFYTLRSGVDLKQLVSAEVHVPGAKSPEGIGLGQTLGDVYKLGQVDCDADVNPAQVRCVFLGDTTIAYSAKDTTKDADGLLPPEDQIKQLKITGIIWRANML